VAGTEGAGQIAAHGSQGEGLGAGEIVIQRLLLYWVEVHRGHSVPDQGIQSALPINPYAAQSSPGLGNHAEVGTEPTLHLLVLERLPKTGFIR